ncbi:UDPglucose 6-dehydrogenase [Motilibacter rhizosphaerae]|uniref:UDP-glucose 6-dehydrogenase n=1 Tax=Motilibacter rhizosphaerae TaxID=598652 RepID=A0A4Q7NVN4_9ACTN|nr:nucleotide sugar dehydrogenase [Motilibacter rhizosphaerae]RZS90938.1 UDPglucose 6-dehydrogenase [Motilibacter rhizosphaerae]
MRVSVFGLGKLGAPLAAVFAASGHDVVAVDVSPSVVDLVNAGTAPVSEPGLQDLMDAGRVRLRATLDPVEAVHASDATFVIVPTPSAPEGGFTNAYLLDALRRIGAAVATKSGYHAVNVTSTVMPGSCDGELRAALEEASGRTVGVDLGLTYSPEFIALGSVVHDMLYPDVLLLGESDPRAGDLVSAIATSSVRNDPALRRMSLVNAELVKISVNTYVTTKISFANMLGEICDRLPGADADVVTAAIGCDSRIGRKYLSAATGYGGPCFPRDNRAFALLASQLGVEATLAKATDVVNKRQTERLHELVGMLASPGDVVAVLGLSYKPGTWFSEESAGLDLLRTLVSAGHEVLGHDPLALDGPVPLVEPGGTLSSDLADVLARADVVVIATAHPEYATLSRLRAHTVLDCWGTTDAAALPADTSYVRLGRAAATRAVRQPASAAA